MSIRWDVIWAWPFLVWYFTALYVVVPLFKKGSRNKSVNYRPVSLTSVICKLLETIIRDHMMDFLVKHKLINPSQHGFLKAYISYFISITNCLNRWPPQ